MRIDIHVHNRAIEAKLDTVLGLLHQILAKERQMSAELDALTAEVTRDKDIQASAVKLIQGIAAQIEANKTDPAALTQLAADLKASDDALAAAVAANTPAPPPAATPAV